MFTRTSLASVLTTSLCLSLGFLGIVLVSRFVGPLPLSMTQTTIQKQSTFDVTGESKITTIPDKAVVSLGVTVNESTVKQAQDKANTIINTIIAKLSKLGVDKKDITTTNYSLNPNYDYQQGQRITGYSVSANLSISISDFNILNQVIDAATSTGANQVENIQFTLSDQKKKDIENDARKQAIDNAKDKAKTLSSLAGMRLGKIVNISEAPQFQPRPYELTKVNAGVNGEPANVPTQVEPGSTSFTYSVTLSYETF